MPIEITGYVDKDAPPMGSQDVCGRLACKLPRWKHENNALGHEFVEV